MLLKQAQTLVDKILASMRSYTLRAEVAGSIRRKKPDVKDIEIVAIPALGEMTDLFEEHRANLLYDWARQMEAQDKIHWIKPSTDQVMRWPLDPKGKYWRGLLVQSQIKLDLFLTTPETWGTTFIIRTGPADFSHRIVADAPHQTGHQFAEGKLYDRNGKFVPTPEEEDVFVALTRHYIKPEFRA